MERNIEFTTALMENIIQNAHNFQENNRDYERYSTGVSSMIRIIDRIRSLLYKRLGVILDFTPYRTSKNSAAALTGDLQGLADFYSLLEDQNSKELLVRLIAYRLLGSEKVRLPLNTQSFWAKRESLKSLLDSKKTIKANFNAWNLAYVDLTDIGYPIKLYYGASGIHTLFELKEYEYHQCSPVIKAMEGDVVIDAGGCWGDTALYFANEVGPGGKVFSFEFVPGNLNIMNRNLALNPELRDRIEVIEKPLWDQSEQILYCEVNGPGSRVSFERSSEADVVVPTITIDDFLEQNQIERVDFIKMDIEGAELNALKGAVRAIEKFRPKLAISIYHRPQDFVTIPRFLTSLNLNYEFYLGHYTIHVEETVLFAVPRE